jgi:hypothetical protein
MENSTNSAASQRAAALHHAGNSALTAFCVAYLCLTSASLPSPPPLVMSCSCLPWLVVVLSLINLQLCNCHPPLPLPPMVGCCIFCPLHHLSSLLRGLSSHCAVASNSASLGHLIWLVVASPLPLPPSPTCWHLRFLLCDCLSCL